jgi:regulator of cell morphogenesis and NO signaling
MMVTLRTPIGDIAAKQPRAAAVFERHGIDYCCEGGRPLEAACERVSANPADVLQAIERAASEALDERDWTGASLRELSEHIVTAHHAALRRGAAALAVRLQDLAGTGAGVTAAVAEDLAARFTEIRDGLEPHLIVEERRVFPAIAAAERARLASRAIPPDVAALLRAEIPRLIVHHRATDGGLRELRQAALVVLPTHAAVVDELVAFEASVHRHLHLENNILFPRATALEAAYA